MITGSAVAFSRMRREFLLFRVTDAPYRLALRCRVEHVARFKAMRAKHMNGDEWPL